MARTMTVDLGNELRHYVESILLNQEIIEVIVRS